MTIEMFATREDRVVKNPAPRAYANIERSAIGLAKYIDVVPLSAGLNEGKNFNLIHALIVSLSY